MRLILLWVVICVAAVQLPAQEVPSRLTFGNMELRLNNALRREIETQAQKLSRYPKYFNIKLTKAKLYFPIIERIFAEENVPDEFKYLVVQESALIPDAVSTANAVGFWQFKTEAATEVGLRIDNRVDERMNIVSATRGAARYLKTNNFYYDNWIYALLAYNTGRGGARKYVDQKQYGARVMELNKDTHWYVKTFLAHMIAIKENIAQCPEPEFYLFEYDQGAGRSLRQVASEFGASESDLEAYNKWLRRGSIPDDKPYTIIIPVAGTRPDNKLLAKQTVQRTRDIRQKVALDYQAQAQFPVIAEAEMPDMTIVEINGKKGVVANQDDNFQLLNRLSGLSADRFRNYNDMDQSSIEPGQVYYFQKKRNKAQAHYHVVMPGETWWSISQKYAIKLRKLKEKNRFREDDTQDLEPGRVLWLRFIRPAHIPVEYRQIENPAPEPAEPQNNAEQVADARPETHAEESTEPLPEDFYQEEEEQSGSTEIEPPVPAKTELAREDVEQVTTRPATEQQSAENNDSAGNVRFHVVNPGETLYSIARQYNYSVEFLMETNQIEDVSSLKPGQKLFFEAPPEEIAIQNPPQSQQSDENTYIYHTVDSGDTMYKIARQYNVTIKDLMQWNEKEDFNLRMGEKLKIKNTP